MFDKYDILSHIEREIAVEITASQINEFREARLMTKFDHKRNLPKLFSKNHLSILPISRGSYLISKFEAYKDIEEIESEIYKVSFPDYIESIDYENITSEAMAINCAYVSGILADFIEDNNLLPTVSGRMSSNTFSFNINNTKLKLPVSVKVANSQVEIDGGYEGLNCLSLIEAKNSISDDFLIRQLYYPYRLWQSKIDKNVKPIFMIYSNGIFNLYEYIFEDINNYNSITLVKQKNYTIEDLDITLDDILQILRNVNTVDEPEIPFPQANSFKRVINICELLSESERTRDEITLNYDFDPRQTNYYTDAARYLSLVDKRYENGEVIYYLTAEGKKLSKLKYKARQLKFVELILQHKVFRETLQKCLEYGYMPPKYEIVEIMKSSNLHRIASNETFGRRASTISGWINWILELQR
ncbi:MAG: transcriptional regulator [Clostridiaceae bacterium]|nr:transcriptional regulator [Clostridiaceae bacterium]